MGKKRNSHPGGKRTSNFILEIEPRDCILTRKHPDYDFQILLRPRFTAVSHSPQTSSPFDVRSPDPSVIQQQSVLCLLHNSLFSKAQTDHELSGKVSRYSLPALSAGNGSGVISALTPFLTSQLEHYEGRRPLRR